MSAVDIAGCAAQSFRWPQVIARATIYRARVGKRRPFQSEADALAYEQGYENVHGDYAEGTPAAVGASDRFLDDEEDQQRRDERNERISAARWEE